jgi:hypothetical protein
VQPTGNGSMGFQQPVRLTMLIVVLHDDAKELHVTAF